MNCAGEEEPLASGHLANLDRHESLKVDEKYLDFVQVEQACFFLTEHLVSPGSEVLMIGKNHGSCIEPARPLSVGLE